MSEVRPAGAPGDGPGRTPGPGPRQRPGPQGSPGAGVGPAQGARPSRTAPRPRAAPPRGPRETRQAWCLAWGLLAAAGVLGVYRLFVRDPRGLLLDHAAFRGAGLGRSEVEPIAHPVLGIVSVEFLMVAITVAVFFAVLRRRWGDALRAVLVAGGANLTTQLLKAALDRPDTAYLTDYNLDNSLPSGHTTVAASVVAMAMLVVPRALRAWAALIGAVYIAATGVATMSLAWHRPSDALAAIGVVAAWTLLVLVPDRTRAPADTRTSPVRVAIAWLLGLTTLAGLTIATLTARRTLGIAGADLTSASTALDRGAAQVMFLGAAFGVVGTAALACWVVLLARR